MTNRTSILRRLVDVVRGHPAEPTSTSPERIALIAIAAASTYAALDAVTVDRVFAFAVLAAGCMVAAVVLPDTHGPRSGRS